MTLSNQDIATIFENVADLMQIKGENIHRILSYRRAAEVIREQPRDLAAISAEGHLTDIPGIGNTIATKIDEMLTTGKLEFYERLKGEVPVGLLDVIRVNGVGHKKAKLFWDELGVTNLSELEAAAKEEKLRNLPKMGAKSEQKILDGIEALARHQGRTSIGAALPAAQAILDQLMQMPEAIEGAVAGSIRRGRPTIGDVDLLIASDEPEPIMNYFVSMGNVARVLGHGNTKSSIELINGLQVDLRILEKARWGTALNYFTGSQAHNIRMRQLALAKRLSLNEHAFSPVDDNNEIIESAEKILCDTEEQVYATVDLPWIPPEIREDAGEIEAAQAGKLPTLIELNDIQADLHMHTTWSDGKLSIREMAETARALGRKYIVITDHSRSLGIANGLSIERLLEQQKEVRTVNEQMGDDFTVLHGTEMDIKTDGTMDFPDDILEQLDFVIASLHVGLQQDREQITERLLNAITNPHVDLIGHPFARQIPVREPVQMDVDTVFEAARKHNTALEINANPIRLDLDAQYARRAIELGITLSINTDAHSAEMMNHMPYGIMTARRGWVTAESVINTWSYEKFIHWLHERNN